MIFAKKMCDEIAEKQKRETDQKKKKQLDRMYATCLKVPLEPADTFLEAVQAIWTVKTAVELAHPVNLHSFGRLDQLLNPYYLQDVAAGILSKEEAIEILAELMLKTMSKNMRPETGI